MLSFVLMNIRIFPPALILSAALLLFGCRRAVNVEGGSGRGGPVPVLATEVVRKDVPMKVRAIGAVKAPASVTVKPQVGGKIESANFTQGQDVKRGDLLFTIDRRPFEVTLAQARAALDQVKAQAANASDQAARYQTLSRSGAVAAEQFEQIKTALRTTAAAVKSGEAAVESAQLQLDYCEIRSPLSGRAGGFLVDPGNVVQANQTDLVVINQIDPIEVTFAVAERHLQDIRRYQNEGQLKVMVVPDGANPQPEWGKLTFVDNAVKSATGTIELKAEFANDTKTLWPGQFVDVELWLTIERGAVVVPANAV